MVPERITVGQPAEPTSRTDRFVLRHLYEPLIRISCDGRAMPALAESWKGLGEGRWLITIRNEARFWDGTPVQSNQVLASWAGHRTADLSLEWAGIKNVTEIDERQILVAFDADTPEIPRALADPRLAVRFRVKGDWPLGSGVYRPTYHDSASVIIESWDSGIPGSRDVPKVVEFHTVRGAAARELVDREADYLFSEDRSLLEYAAARPRYSVQALPWDLSYRLFIPDIRTAAAPSQGPDSGFLETIARDAVEGDARVSPDGLEWRHESCGLGVGATPDGRDRPRRVVYPSADETARALAHRLVSFAGAPGQGGEWLGLAFRNPLAARTFPFAIGLEPAAWPVAMQAGNEVAYVFAMPVREIAPCALPLRTDGSWMTLVETRAHAVVGPDLPGLKLDWDGTPRLAGVP